jgi:hypothetical protein
MFERFLFKENLIDQLDENPVFVNFKNYSRVLLSPPELRRKGISSSYGFQVYDGYLHRVGWYGCSMSYRMLSIAALQDNVQQLIVAEDDVTLPESFDSVLENVVSFLSSYANWHIYCGLVADVVPSTVVTDVFLYRGIRFVVLDRMTSTVFNIYNKPALEMLASYKLNRSSVLTENYIDRFLGSRLSLRVVTTVPFIFQHDEDSRSTLLRGESNKKLYSGMIHNSESLLSNKIKEFYEKSGKQVPL